MENLWWKENICSMGSELTLCANRKDQSSSQIGVSQINCLLLPRHYLTAQLHRPIVQSS